MLDVRRVSDRMSLGLFDMPGDLYEWVQDQNQVYKGSQAQAVPDEIKISVHIDENPRLLRGGAFNYQPAFVRSANRIRFAPASRISNFGFRPSRTYH